MQPYFSGGWVGGWVAGRWLEELELRLTLQLGFGLGLAKNAVNSGQLVPFRSGPYIK